MGTKEHIFTFGSGQTLEGFCVRIKGDYGKARERMMQSFGDEWAFQYPADEWDAVSDPRKEKELSLTEAERLYSMRKDDGNDRMRLWEIRWVCNNKYRLDEIKAIDVEDAIIRIKKAVMGDADFEHTFLSVKMIGEE